MDKQISSLLNDTIKTVFKYAVAVSIAMIIFYKKDYSIILGLAFGCIVALINFYIMAYCINNLFNGNVKSRHYYSVLYLIRLLASCVAILYAIKLESLDLFTTVLGLLSIKIIFTVKAILSGIEEGAPLS